MTGSAPPLHRPPAPHILDTGELFSPPAHMSRSREDRLSSDLRPHDVAGNSSSWHACPSSGIDRTRPDGADRRCDERGVDSAFHSARRVSAQGSEDGNWDTPLQRRRGGSPAGPADRTSHRCDALLRNACRRMARARTRARAKCCRIRTVEQRTPADSRWRSTHRGRGCARSWRRGARTRRKSAVLDGQCPWFIPANRTRRCA